MIREVKTLTPGHPACKAWSWGPPAAPGQSYSINCLHWIPHSAPGEGVIEDLRETQISCRVTGGKRDWGFLYKKTTLSRPGTVRLRDQGQIGNRSEFTTHSPHERHSTSSAIRATQIKTIMRHHFTPTRMIIIKKMEKLESS